MGDLTANFNRKEFACKCGCGFATVDFDLLLALKTIRAKFKKPITINSSCRCLEHNEAVQKEANINYVPYSSKSKHMQGIAADIVVKDVHPNDVYRYVDKLYSDKYGIGKYNGFTHIDVIQKKARW